jgi:lysophospholipase L1-like esterase
MAKSRRQLSENDRLPTMSARGRFLSVLVTIVVALAGFVTVGALPAAASPPIVKYVALGDSYAAGTAAGGFPDCQHGDGGYPALLDSEERIRLRANEACSGATTDEVTDSQLSALNGGTRLVTLTVGGNDLDVSGLATLCLTTPANCEAEILERLDLLDELGRDLRVLYAEVAEEAPKALIVVTGYPHLLEAPPFPQDLVDALNFATNQLNLTIAAAVAAADPTGEKIVYVDVVGAFKGHGIGSPAPFINPPGVPEAFHPNAAGYRAYADVISAELDARLDEQAQLV